jgi:hypothetical protein
MKYAIEMASDAMVYVPDFMTIISNIRVILKLLPHQIERLQGWYYD